MLLCNSHCLSDVGINNVDYNNTCVMSWPGTSAAGRVTYLKSFGKGGATPIQQHTCVIPCVRNSVLSCAGMYGPSQHTGAQSFQPQVREGVCMPR
eukprot:scaffold375_cov378-Prasinococcus_capsulatus_cf.AAC.4